MRLNNSESALILPGEQKDLFGLHDRVRLNAALTSVISVIESADSKTTVQAHELTHQSMHQIDTQLNALDVVFDTELGHLTQAITSAGLAPIVIASDQPAHPKHPPLRGCR